jgi:hypothetical protein
MTKLKQQGNQDRTEISDMQREFAERPRLWMWLPTVPGSVAEFIASPSPGQVPDFVDPSPPSAD